MISQLLNNFHLKVFLKLFIFLLISFSELRAQKNYYFSLYTIRGPNWPSVHSFTFGEWEGKVYMFGGRKNGIHEKNPGSKENQQPSTLYLGSYKMEVDSIDLQFLPDSIIDPWVPQYISCSKKSISICDWWLPKMLKTVL
ncbi:MAG: hypothetical protein IPN97_08165 [Saprospiraceae bacterium]|nr:hypothetical protein [Saprospiraceae bacterium]